MVYSVKIIFKLIASKKFNVNESEKNRLRKRINECWKSIYHNLGRNKDQPLDDDVFLRNHFLIYFGKKIFNDLKGKLKEDISYALFLRSRRRGNLDYPVFLLEEHFVTKNILCDDVPNGITMHAGCLRICSKFTKLC